MRATAAQENLLEKFSHLPPHKKLLMLVMATLLFVLIFYGVEAHFRGNTLRQAMQRERVLKQSFENQYRQYSQLNHMKKQSLAMQAQLKQMQQRLPTRSQMDKILKKITQLGHAAGISFVVFKPQEKESFGFYGDTPIKIAVLGNYHQMANFLSKIANMKQLVTVHDFNVRRSNPKQNVLTMNLTIKVYHQLQQGNL